MRLQRGCINQTARKAVASYVNGRQMVHDNFDHTAGLFWDDGVHLSDIGSDLFLANIQEALRSFIKTDKVMYSANE